MDRSLSASRISSSILAGATTDELSFSVSMIMLLISSWRKESKVKMCPSCILLSVDIFFFRLFIWCLNHSLLLLRRLRYSYRCFYIFYRLSLDARKALLQYSFSALRRQIYVYSFQLSVLLFDYFLLFEFRLPFWFFLLKNFSFLTSLSSEAVSLLRLWINRFALVLAFSSGKCEQLPSLFESFELLGLLFCLLWLLVRLEALTLSLVYGLAGCFGLCRSFKLARSILSFDFDLEKDFCVFLLGSVSLCMPNYNFTL